MIIVKSFEEAGLLKKGASKTIEKVDFLGLY